MDLKVPCKNCPFSVAETRIRFACAERAEEIAESAYRNGFPCHLSAELVEDDEGDDDGFYATEDGQHCIGSIMMIYQDTFCSGDGWPGIDNEELPEAVLERIWPNLHLAFDSEEAFIDANRNPHPSPESLGG